VLKWLKTEDPTRGAQHQPEGVVAEARRDSEVPFSNGHLSLLFQDPTPTHGKGVPRIYIYNIFIPFFSGRSPDSGIIRIRQGPVLKNAKSNLASQRLFRTENSHQSKWQETHQARFAFQNGINAFLEDEVGKIH
jgi:hypothetical protein